MNNCHRIDQGIHSNHLLKAWEKERKEKYLKPVLYWFVSQVLYHMIMNDDENKQTNFVPQVRLMIKLIRSLFFEKKTFVLQIFIFFILPIMKSFVKNIEFIFTKHSEDNCS